MLKSCCYFCRLHAFFLFTPEKCFSEYHVRIDLEFFYVFNQGVVYCIVINILLGQKGINKLKNCQMCCNELFPCKCSIFRIFQSTDKKFIWCTQYSSVLCHGYEDIFSWSWKFKMFDPKWISYIYCHVLSRPILIAFL